MLLVYTLHTFESESIISFSCSIGCVCIELSLTNGATSPVPFVFIILPTTTSFILYFFITSIYLFISFIVMSSKTGFM